MAKKKKTSRYDDYITNQILGIFTFAFLIIIGLMATYRGFARIDTIESTIRIVYGFSAFAAVIAVAGLVWEYLSRKRGRDMRYKVIRGRNLAAVSAFTAICSLIAARFFIDGIKFLYIIVPAAAVLVLIYMIYSAEFFTIAAVTSLSGLLMWHLSRSYFSQPITELKIYGLAGDYSFYAAVLLLALLVVAAFLVFSASKHNGELKIGGRPRKLFDSSANYPLIYISIAFSALSTIAALVFGSGVAYYLIFGIFGYLFITAVYYTVKMM